MLQALAAEAVRLGYDVRQSRSCFSRREGRVDVVVGEFACGVSVRQEFPQSTNAERSAGIVVELTMAGPCAQRLGGRSERRDALDP